MKQLFCSIVALIAALPLHSQAVHPFKVPGEPTIECIKVSEGYGSYKQRKPVIVVINGSLAYPLIVLQNGGQPLIVHLNNFNYRALLADYHFVMFSHPYVPATASAEEIKDNFRYSFPDSLRELFLDANYLENQVRRGNAVLDYLKTVPWAGEIILLGHSQGAKVGAYMAMERNDIYALGYFSGNPMGRFTGMVEQQRREAQSGRITNEKAQAEIDDLYDWWRYLCSDEYKQTPTGDRKRTWLSFSKPYADKMAQIAAPLYIAYGTEDAGASSCDFLPIYLEMGGKQNYKMAPFLGRGHNFEVVKNGVSDFEDMQWQEAIEGFIQWLKEL